MSHPRRKSTLGLRTKDTDNAMRLLITQAQDIPINVKDSAPNRHLMETFWAWVDHRTKKVKK